MTMPPTQAWFARHALLPEGLATDVLLEAEDGRFTRITPGGSPTGAVSLPGVVLPGFANGHSHAFHRALRGRTHADGGTFWTWRQRMYALAGRLDPDGYFALARAVFAEMALAGVTAVGEFHYLHHAPGGRRYDDPNAMGEALRAAARDAGLRLTLLDACYLAGGLTADGYQPLDTVQQRFSDGDADAWAARAGGRRTPDPGESLGVAVHSVRAVPPAATRTVATAAGDRPLHVHVSEQPAENEACLAALGGTPAAALSDAGVLTARSTAVHATHLTESDKQLLKVSKTTVCMCPTTERDLADGVGPASELRTLGVPISLGSDQNAVVDLFEEARGLELDERLVTGRRGRFRPEELTAAMTSHASLGWPDAGALAPGRRADLVAVRLDSPRTAGCPPDQIAFAAAAADVDTVVVDGRPVVQNGGHVLGDVGRLLADSIEAAWRP